MKNFNHFLLRARALKLYGEPLDKPFREGSQC